MAVQNSVEVPSKDMKMEDLSEFSNIFASQFDNSEIHDRVLCFQIITDGKSETEVDFENKENETLSSRMYFRLLRSRRRELNMENERKGNGCKYGCIIGAKVASNFIRLATIRHKPDGRKNQAGGIGVEIRSENFRN